MASFENANYICTCFAKKCDRDCKTYRRFTHTESNADRIRSMTDEELARYIVHLVKQGNRQSMADYECALNWLRDEYDRFFFDEWLKQENETN